MNVDELVLAIAEKHGLGERWDSELFVCDKTAEAAIREAILETRKTQWIPVSERLPEPGMKFLGYDKFNEFCTGTFTTSEADAIESYDFYSARSFKASNITEWMQIFEPLSSPAASKPQDATEMDAARNIKNDADEGEAARRTNERK